MLNSKKKFYLVFLLINLSFYENSLSKPNNSRTKYFHEKPDGVCFEGSDDKYKIKKKHSVSDLMNYFELRPLYCKNCSVETAQEINQLEDVDYIQPGQILIIPKKCTQFNWIDNFDYKKIREKRQNDSQAQEIMENRSKKINPQDYKTTSANKNDNFDPSFKQFSISPFVIYKELKISSIDFKGTLRSDLGKGLEFTYYKNLTPTSSIVLNGELYQINLNDDKEDQISINSSNNYLYYIYSSFKSQISSRSSFYVNLSLFENLYPHRDSTNTLKSDKFIDFALGIKPEYILYQENNYEFYINLEYNIIFPQKTYYGNTDYGYLAGTTLGIEYDLKYIQMLSTAQLGQRYQKSDNFIVEENYFKFSMGAAFSF